MNAWEMSCLGIVVAVIGLMTQVTTNREAGHRRFHLRANANGWVTLGFMLMGLFAGWTLARLITRWVAANSFIVAQVVIVTVVATFAFVELVQFIHRRLDSRKKR